MLLLFPLIAVLMIRKNTIYIEDLIQLKGATVQYLSPYSLDLNPIES